jgi:DNA-binding transcriptional regulator YiaG
LTIKSEYIKLIISKQLEEQMTSDANLDGLKLFESRQRMGLSRAKFGKLVGRTGVTIWNYETGRSDIPAAIKLAVQALEMQKEKEEQQSSAGK